MSMKIEHVNSLKSLLKVMVSMTTYKITQSVGFIITLMKTC